MEKRARRDDGVRQLFELIRRVNSSTNTTQVLSEIVACVVDNLGFGLAAIARHEADTLVVQAYAGPDDLRDQLMGRRTPVEAMDAQFRLADCWGVLRYVPHDRVDDDFLENAWIPQYEPIDAPDAWHPEDALYAPLYSATGELVGNMAVDFPPEGRIPNQELRELLELFVVQAGLALSNAQQRERLAEQVRINRIIKDVALATSLRDLDAALTQAAESITVGFGATHTAIQYIPDAAGGKWAAAVHPPVNNLERSPSSKASMAPLGASSSSREAGEVALSGVDIESARESTWDDQPASRRDEPLPGAHLRIPLEVGSESVGHLVLIPNEDRDLTTREHTALQEMARELGRCVLNHRVSQRETQLISELQQLDRYKDDLIATISHELKTPLTSIIGHAELLAHSTEGEPSRSLTAIRRSAERLTSLVADLLDYSRVQQQGDHSHRDVDIVATVRNSIELHQLQATSLGVGLKFDAPDRANVFGDPEKLCRVVDNLVGNAIKYSPDGGDVEVVVRADSTGVEVEVSDHGLGISAEDQARLFSPFHRSRNPLALAIPGTGLGLAIAQKVATLHGGAISVESELGVGSTFRLRLPIGAA